MSPDPSIPSAQIYYPPSLAKGAYLSWGIVLTPELIKAISGSSRIGSGLSISSFVFAGIRGIKIGQGREKLLRILNDCPPTAEKSSLAGASRSSTEKKLSESSYKGNRASNAVAAADVVLAKRVARNFKAEIKQGGMAGMKYSVETCYSIVKKRPQIDKIKYCYLLDQLASATDAGFMKYFNRPQDHYWQRQTALKRTLEVLRLIKLSAAETMQVIENWEVLQRLALREYVNLPRERQ